MTQLERQIRSAKHRLWLNRWFHQLSWTVTGSAGLLAVVVLIQRLYDAPLPLLWVAVGFLAAALIGSSVWTFVTRETDSFSAARLDEAAGLRERISSGRYCLTSNDPFAQAVVADAAKISGSLAVRRHIRFTIPKPLGFSALSLLLVAGMFLIPLGVLKKADATQTGDANKDLVTTKIAVKKQLDSVRQTIESNPALSELKDDLQKLENLPAANLQRPNDVRHEAMKKIETLADAVKQKRQDDEYESMPALQRKLRGLRAPENADAATQKLTKSLREGDFKTAKEEIAKIKEQLATLKTEQDKEMTQKLSQQLDQLAKQLEQVAKDDKLAEKLENAGLKKEDVERILENLKKEDLEQVRKQLEEKGMDPKQVQGLLNQMQQQQNAGAKCQKMAQSMKQGAKSAAEGQSGEAMSGLSQAEAQLSDLEQMQQEMSELDSTLQSLQAAKDGLSKPCDKCDGSGKKGDKPCSKCGGSGSGQDGPPAGGMGLNMAQGRGGLAQQEEAAHDFKVERAKVHTGKGAVIGQFQVDGEQVPGEASAQLAEVVAAAERDASDRIQRDRIPRQYQKAIKTHFSNVRQKLDDEKKTNGSLDGEKKSNGSANTKEQPKQQNDAAGQPNPSESPK